MAASASGVIRAIVVLFMKSITFSPEENRADRALGSYFREGQTPTPVELAPQGKAFFDIAWNVVPDETQGQRTCPSVTRIRMMAPGDTSAVSLDQALTPCGGRIRVSPFRAAAEPAPTPTAARATWSTCSRSAKSSRPRP